MSVAELPYPGAPPSGGLSPWQLDDDTQLRIVSCNAATSVVIGLQGLRVDARGQAQTIVEAHTPNTNRAIATQNYRIGKGTLLRVTAFVSNGTPLYGQTFVTVQLVRGIDGPIIVLATLFSGYITGNQALGFPGSPANSSIDGGGYLRSIRGSSPAFGAEISETVPTNARWELLELFTTLGTSAAAGARFPRLSLNNSGLQATHVLPAATLAPSKTGSFQWAQNIPVVGPATLSIGEILVQQPLPLGSLLAAGDSFVTTTDNLAAGDLWVNPFYLVREWLEF